MRPGPATPLGGDVGPPHRQVSQLPRQHLLPRQLVRARYRLQSSRLALCAVALLSLDCSYCLRADVRPHAPWRRSGFVSVQRIVAEVAVRVPTPATPRMQPSPGKYEYHHPEAWAWDRVRTAKAKNKVHKDTQRDRRIELADRGCVATWMCYARSGIGRVSGLHPLGGVAIFRARSVRCGFGQGSPTAYDTDLLKAIRLRRLRAHGRAAPDQSARVAVACACQADGEQPTASRS